MDRKKKNSILIVDDERSNISTLRSILSPDYAVYASSDGPDAITTAEEFMPDVILLDIIMPDMDGYAVINELKNSDKTKNIPVIFITGLDNADAEEKGLALGAADYIIKPFHSPIVKMRVHNQIKLLEQLRQQAIMMKISHNFLSDNYIDPLLSDTLQMVGEFMNIAQILLYRAEDDNSTFICQNEWNDPELKLKSGIGKKLKLKEEIITVISNLRARGEFCPNSNNTAYKEAMKQYREDSRSYITAPVFIKGKMFAVLDFSREDDGREWEESEINFAILVSDVISGVFERDAMGRQFSIVENNPNLILSVTDDAALEYANPAVLDVTGYTKNELMKEGFGVIFSEKTINDLKKKHIPAAIRGETVQFETDIVGKGGGKRILLVSVFQTEKKSFGMIFKDMTKIRELEIENEKIFFDGLTNIYNRRFFDESINRMIKSLSRSGSMLSLMMIDIDYFKKYNDTYGHSAGDDCLKIVAETLKKCIPRTDDFVARYGGEEFVTVLPNTDENGARIVANRLLKRIREKNILHENSEAAGFVTISIGVTTGYVEHTHTADNFIKRADEMLYHAKNSGRNRYSFESLGME